MHREIQIKQFPIVTTHWWPKTRNERFVWENEQYLYCFLPLVHNHVQVIWVHTHIRCVTCVCARSGSSIWLADASVGTWKVASAPRFRHALRQALTPTSQSARTHTSHTGCVCALRSLGHGCVQEVKNNINTVSCLRPSMCSYDGELFNLDFSVHVLFPSYRDSDLYLPLYDWQTRTVWPKNIKIGSTEEKKTPTSWMPLG